MESELALINLEFGTKQLSGDVAFLKKLLSRFVTQYEHTGEKLAEFAQHNNLEEMQLLVHTIKGVTGNLGLDRLHHSAKLMDNNLKVGQITPTLLDDLITQLNATLQEINRICNENTEPSDEQSAQSKQQLIKALRQQMFINETQLNQWAKDCQLTPEEHQQLAVAVDQFDYTSALNIVDKP